MVDNTGTKNREFMVYIWNGGATGMPLVKQLLANLKTRIKIN